MGACSESDMIGAQTIAINAVNDVFTAVIKGHDLLVRASGE